METGAHLRAVWVRGWAVLAVAVLVGVLVVALRAAAPTTWTATSELFVTARDDDSDRSVDRLSAAYVSFARDPRVVDEAVRLVAPGASAGRARHAVLDDVEVEDAGDGRLVVTASADAPERAVSLARAVGVALSAAAERDSDQALTRDLEPLDAELELVGRALAERATSGVQDPQERDLLSTREARLDQARVDLLARPRAHLDLVAATELDDVVRAPVPLRDGALAAVLAAVLAAQAAVLLGARRQGLEAVEPVSTLTDWTGLPVFRLGARGELVDQSAAALHVCARSAVPATEVVVHVTWLHPLAVERLVPLERAASDLLGAGTVIATGLGGTELERVESQARAERPVLVLAGPWSSPALVRLVHGVPGPCLLVLERRAVRRPALEEALRVLALAGAAPVALLLLDAAGSPLRVASAQ